MSVDFTLLPDHSTYLTVVTLSLFTLFTFTCVFGSLQPCRLYHCLSILSVLWPAASGFWLPGAQQAQGSPKHTWPTFHRAARPDAHTRHLQWPQVVSFSFGTAAYTLCWQSHSHSHYSLGANVCHPVAVVALSRSKCCVAVLLSKCLVIRSAGFSLVPTFWISIRLSRTTSCSHSSQVCKCFTLPCPLRFVMPFAAVLSVFMMHTVGTPKSAITLCSPNVSHPHFTKA